MAKALFVVNLKAGGGKCERIWANLEPILTKNFHQPLFMFSEYPKQLAQYLQQLPQVPERIIFVGGDGSLHWGVNGVLTAYEGKDLPLLGCLPLGTGSDFARELGLSQDLPRTLECLAGDEARAVDLGRVQFKTPEGLASEYFVNMLNIGLGGEVARYVAEHDFFHRALLYTIGAVRGAVVAKTIPLTLSYKNASGQEQRSIQAFNIAIANGRFCGAGMKMAPRAQIDDGALDTVTVGALGRLAFFSYFPRIFWGGHLAHPMIQTFQTTEITVSSHETFDWEMDGEIHRDQSITVSLLPRHVRFLHQPILRISAKP